MFEVSALRARRKGDKERTDDVVLKVPARGGVPVEGEEVDGASLALVDEVLDPLLAGGSARGTSDCDSKLDFISDGGEEESGRVTHGQACTAP